MSAHFDFVSFLCVSPGDIRTFLIINLVFNNIDMF